MQVTLEEKHTGHINNRTVLQQTAFWAKVKQAHGYDTRAFDMHVKTAKQYRDDMLVVIRDIGDHAVMAYVPYGPTFNPGQDSEGQYLETLSESLRPFLPDNCMFIRYDLTWRSPWMDDKNRYDENSQYMGPPEPRVRELRMNINTQKWRLRKAPTDILPAHTVFVDIRQDKNMLLQRMKPKTRYNIRLAKRKGVSVNTVDHEKLPLWYDMYTATTRRNGIISKDIDYFRSVINATKTKHTAKAGIHLLMAEVGDKPLAGMFLAISGKRATYLYGASSKENRNFMGTYALQWKAMKLANKAGCKEYDMFGVAPAPVPSHPMYGLYRFKTGFGGYMYHRQGCWDYPLNEKQYDVYRAVELNGQGYHVN